MNRLLVLAAVGSALLAGAVALPVMAQRGPPPRQAAGAANPFQGKPEAIAAGVKLYNDNCLTCHGANGGAGEIGPALVNSTGPDTPRAPSHLFDAIKNGVAGTAMPAWSGKISDDDTWRIVAFISSLRGTAIDTPSEGDAARGEQVFWGNGQCGACHMVKGRGGLTGPELSNIAGFRKTQSIVDALTKPHHRVYPPGGAHLLETPTRGDWRPVTVVTREGKTIAGVLINQDTHGLQIMGDDEKLHLFVRRELRSVKVEERSRMPTDYDKRLSREEFRNLVAFLTRQANMPRPGVEVGAAANQLR